MTIASEAENIWAANENIDNSLNFLYYPNTNNESNNNIYFYLFTSAVKKAAQTMSVAAATTTPAAAMTTNLTNSLTTCTLEPTYIFEEQICYLYIMCPIAIIGVILNLISIRIFNDKSFNTVAFSYLRLMTWIDLIICAIIIVYCITGYTMVFNKYDLYIRNLYLAYIFVPFANILSNFTMLLKLLVTVERLVSVRWPTKKYKLFKKSRYYLSCIIAAIIAVTVNFLYFFLYEVALCVFQTRPFTNGTFWKIYGYVKEVLMRIVPIILLVGANALLVYTVKMSRKRMNKNKKRPNNNTNGGTASAVDIAANKRSRQDFQLTIMTIIVAAMYSVSSIPMVFAYPGLVFHGVQLNSKFYRIYAASVNILELSSTSFRFIIYYCFTTQFRQLFLAKYSNLFHPCKQQQQQAVAHNSSEKELLNKQQNKDRTTVQLQQQHTHS